MRKIVFLILATCLFSCRSYHALEKTPQIYVQEKLPTLDFILDEQSFATVTGYSKTTGATSYVSNNNMVVGLGVASTEQTQYASAELNNIKSLYIKNMSQICNTIGEKKGSVVCRLFYGTQKDNYGMCVLSAFTLCTINLLGVPFASNKAVLSVEIQFLDKNNNVIATYQSKDCKSKKYAAMYWGYSEPKEVTIPEAFKECLHDLNKQIYADMPKLLDLYK